MQNKHCLTPHNERDPRILLADRYNKNFTRTIQIESEAERI